MKEFSIICTCILLWLFAFKLGDWVYYLRKRRLFKRDLRNLGLRSSIYISKNMQFPESPWDGCVDLYPVREWRIKDIGWRNGKPWVLIEDENSWKPRVLHMPVEEFLSKMEYKNSK